MLRKRTVLAVVILAAFTGCTTTPEALQSLGDRNYMRYATGKPYAQIASQSKMSVEGLAGATIYGPMIGEYRLVDGDTVYRHIDNVESTRTGVNAGLLMQRESVGTRYRLAYFRVGPDVSSRIGRQAPYQASGWAAPGMQAVSSSNAAAKHSACKALPSTIRWYGRPATCLCLHGALRSPARNSQSRLTRTC